MEKGIAAMAVEVKKVNNLKAAQAALREFLDKRTELDALKAKHGISQLEVELEHIKKTVTTWAVENDVDKIDLGKDGHATLIRGRYDGHFIGTANDITGEESRAVIPLRTVIYQKYKADRGKAKALWFMVTKRVPDADLIQNAVNSGDLTVDEVATSYVDKEKTPYLRLY